MSQLFWLLLGQTVLTVLMCLFWYFTRAETNCPYCRTVRRTKLQRLADHFNRWLRKLREVRRFPKTKDIEELPF